MSRAHEMGAFPASISPGKLTEDDVMEAFKDVHTRLKTLGSPLHITLNPNVTPIQAHPIDVLLPRRQRQQRPFVTYKSKVS